MNVWRLAFLISQHSFLQTSNWTLYLWSFLVGVRLDAVVASYLIVPLIGLAILQALLPRKAFFRYFSLAYLFVVTSIISLINLVDLYVFQEFDNHLNFLTLLSYTNQKDSMEFIFEEYPVWRGILGLLLFTSGCIVLYRLVSSRIKSRPSSVFVSISAIVFSLLVLGTTFRGGWQERPIDWGVAMFSNDFTANQTALNSLFFLGRSMVQFSSEQNADKFTHYDDPHEAFLATRDLLTDPNLTYTDDISMTRQFVAADGPKANIVLLILESNTAAFTGYLNSEKHSITPNLDRLAHEGLAFTNCFANGIRSAHGISSIIMSWPNLPGLPLISRTESVNQVPSLASTLKAVGYSTLFMYGGDSQFDNMNGFASVHGFDRVVDRQDFSSSAPGTKWGVFDHIVLNRTLAELDSLSKPVFLTLFTTTNHQPWEIPADYAASIPAFPDRLYRQGQVHRSMAYVDRVIGEFMDEASQHQWYTNTIFVFIADHGLNVHKSPFAKVQNAHIPFVIYAPGLELEPRIITRPVSQIDVAPTLLGLINYSQPFTFFGQNALSAKNGVALKIIGGEAFWLQDEYLYYERFGQDAKLYQVHYPVENGEFTPVTDSQIFNRYQHNFHSYLQTASSQFKAFGSGGR